MIPLRRLLFYARTRSRPNAALCISQPFYKGRSGGNHTKAGFATRPLLMAAAAGMGIILHDVEGPSGPPRRLQEKFLKVGQGITAIFTLLGAFNLCCGCITFWCGSDPNPWIHASN